MKNEKPENVKKLVRKLKLHEADLREKNRRLREAQVELKASRDKFAELYDYAPVGYLTIGEKGIIADCNVTLASMLRTQRDGLLRKRLSRFVAGADQDTYYHFMNGLSSQEVPRGCEITLIKRDGTLFPASLEAVGLRDARGNTLMARVAVSDISERKKAEDALFSLQKDLEKQVRERTSELARANENLGAALKQQKAILDSIPDIAWLKDSQSRFIAVNEPFGKSCGRKPEKIAGKTDFDVWPSELAERYRADDRQVMESGRMKKVEEPLAGASGERSWIETIKVPIYSDKGKIMGTAGIARDITERKKAETLMAGYHEQLEKVVHERTRDIKKANLVLAAEVAGHKKTVEDLKHRLEMEGLMIRISSRLMGVPSSGIAPAIRSSLQDVCETAGFERCDLAFFSRDGKTMGEVYNYTGKGMTPSAKKLEGLPIDLFPWAMGRLGNEGILQVPSVSDLPPEAELEKKFWESEGIVSLGLIPLPGDKRMSGLLGFFSKKKERNWSEEDARLLKLAGKLFWQARPGIKKPRIVRPDGNSGVIS